MSQPRLRSSHRRDVKFRKMYREPDSETDIEYESTKTKSQPTRSSRRIQTYLERTTSDEDGLCVSSGSLSESELPLPLSHRPARKNSSQNAVRRSQRNKRTAPQPKSVTGTWAIKSLKRQKVQHTSQVNTKIHRDTHDNGTSLAANLDAPPWQTLEYHILLRIIQYAAHPLYSSVTRSFPSVEWLLGVSRLCKSFHDASTAALLQEPPLIPNYRVHGLIRLLSQDQTLLMTNYRTKIRSLNIEVKHLVAKSGFDLPNLLKYTPLLSQLRVSHHHDEMIGKAIWAEPTVAHFKWSYGKLFDHLDDNQIRLKSFEWNGRFQDTLSIMVSAHQRACMSTLEDVSIVNLNFTDKQEAERARTRETLVLALSSLERLKRLEFHNCTVLDPSTMSQLPLGLEGLTVVNCLSITSEGVNSYLALSGHSIRSLYLGGNQVMDLGFIPDLSKKCPSLIDLYIDLSYEDCSSYRDRNPLYDELLPNGSPTWPSTLNSVIIGPLRSLDVAQAEEFYSSLIDAAEMLPYLRILSIKSILNDASWRDRARLRAKWRPLFEKVFSANKTYVPTFSKPKPKPARFKSSQRKSARLQELEDSSISEDVDDGGDSLSVASAVPRQNRCEIVEFELSDQRPAQEQFREDDFLDSEPSDDDEWNGRDQTASGLGYAW